MNHYKEIYELGNKEIKDCLIENDLYKDPFKVGKYTLPFR